MGDDVGWFNIGAYHRGIMSGKTPNLDKLAKAGMLFTDYYAEASCTAGRANFITGEIPLRTGLTTVGQAGADVGIPDKAATLAKYTPDTRYWESAAGDEYQVRIYGEVAVVIPAPKVESALVRIVRHLAPPVAHLALFPLALKAVASAVQTSERNIAAPNHRACHFQGIIKLTSRKNQAAVKFSISGSRHPLL
jgi:hypothetical protein